MRTTLIVLRPLLLEDDLGLLHRLEDLFVSALVRPLSVETLALPVLPKTSGSVVQSLCSQVRCHIQRQIAALAPGGDYLFATIHNISPETLWEDVMAVFRAAIDSS